jgi:NADH-quinone oxidoreductase subunit C
MTQTPDQLARSLQTRFEERILSCKVEVGEVTIEIGRDDLLEMCAALRDERDFAFEQLIDLCGVDYASYGQAEWETDEASSSGFSRGVDARTEGRLPASDRELSLETGVQPRRFAVVYHLLSVSRNQRLRIRVFAPDDELPLVNSVTAVWNSANWYEREGFDLYGIVFEGHPDLRRILTDYGFIGHPFRKDFPLSGNVEVIYDAQKRRVVYQPVTITPRVLVPKVIRAAREQAARSEPAGNPRENTA